MPEEKSHEHQEHHSHDENKEKYKFELSKLRVWQGISLILAIAVVFLWFSQSGNITGKAVAEVDQQNVPSQAAQQPQKIGQKIDIDIGDAAFLGAKDAKITVVEFSDFECPYCGAAMGTHQALVQKFKSQDPNWEAAVPKLEELAKQGKIRLVYKHFPLGFHQHAQPAAEASECANEQGKFWDYHDALFQNQESLGRALYIELSEKLGLNTAKFTQCIDSNKYKQKVQNDLNYGAQIGVSGTPTFFINGIGVVGAQPYEVFKQIIDNELANK